MCRHGGPPLAPTKPGIQPGGRHVTGAATINSDNVHPDRTGPRLDPMQPKACHACGGVLAAATPHDLQSGNTTRVAQLVTVEGPTRTSDNAL